jgi:APA family basic amino acid/polyamine antiporter
LKTLERSLGLSAVIAISLGAMMGSGLFVLPGFAASLTGPSIWLAYVVAGLFVLPAALSKSELATAMPTSGGTYVYIDRAFGPLAGTIAGMGLWLSLLLKSAFALVGFGAYLAVIADVSVRPVALLLLAAVVALNVMGVKKVGKFQVIVMVVAVSGLVVLAFFGFQNSTGVEPLADMFPRGSFGFIEATAFVYISYAGVTKVAAVAEEVKNPQKNIPRGILLSLAIAIVVYGLVTLALVLNVPADELIGDQRPIYTLARAVGGPALGLAAAVLGVLTLTSMSNAGLLASSRFPFAMSRSKLLPSMFSSVHPRFVTPVSCILVTGGVMALAVMFLDVMKIAKLASSFKILIFILVNLTVIVLRESRTQWYKPTFRSPMYPWLHIMGILIGLVQLGMMGLNGALALLAMFGLGTVAFFAYGRSHVDRKGVIFTLGPRTDLITTSFEPAREIDDAITKEAAVAIPLLGRERSPETLVDVAAALADGRSIEVVHLTTVPEQTLLGAMLEEDPRVESLRRRVQATAEDDGIAVEFDAVVTRDVADTVHRLVTKLRSDWLVMEWGLDANVGYVHGHPLGWLVDHLPCNLALYKDRGIRKIREILVLAQPGPHDSLVVTTADHLARMYGAQVTFARFVAEGSTALEVQSETDYLDQLAGLFSRPHGNRILRGKEEVETVVAATSGYDLLVMGAPRGQGLRQRVFGTPMDRITRRAICSVLRLKTPRHRTHDVITTGEFPAVTLKPFDIQDYLEPRCLGARLDVSRKDRLFTALAESFARVHPQLDVEEVERALWERERTQNTAVGMGLALPHATIRSLRAPCLGIFTMASPLNYQAPDGEPVDVIFVTLGPPSGRRIHLELLSSVSRMVLSTDLLADLRTALDPDQMREAFARHAGSFGEGADPGTGEP